MIDLVSFIPRAVVQGIPLLYGSTGETLTEKAGNLNLGIPGVMYVGAISGVIGSFFYEQSGEINGFLAIAIPLLCSLLGSLIMGLIYCFLTVTLSCSRCPSSVPVSCGTGSPGRFPRRHLFTAPRSAPSSMNADMRSSASSSGTKF